MPKSSKRPRGSQRYTAQVFRPYVSALGQLALAWNDLQESLASLFWTTMSKGIPLAGDKVDFAALFVWHAVKSDRYQKDMLRAAVQRSITDWKRQKFRDDATWLLDRANELENWRNDAIHSPLFAVDRSIYGLTEAAAREAVAPAWWLQNPRAINLSRRQHLLGEFRHCRDTAIVLSDFARSIDGALVNPRRPWPDRPSLPIRKPKKDRQHPQARPKSPTPQPQPSLE